MKNKTDKSRRCAVRQLLGPTPRYKGKPIPWKISIDDGFVEYEYELTTRDTHSIATIFETIRKAFRAKKSAGKIRLPNTNRQTTPPSTHANE